MVEITPILGRDLVGCCALDGMGNVKNNANMSDKIWLRVIKVNAIKWTAVDVLSNPYDCQRQS